MKLRYRFYAMAPDGSSVTGKTLRLYPHGYSNDVLRKIDATEIVPPGAVIGIGEYQVVIDPLGVGFNSDMIARTYDFYIVNGVTETLLYTDRSIGQWQWHVQNVLADDDVAGNAYLYSALTDTFGEALPATIPNVTVMIVLHRGDRLCYIPTTDISDTGFTIYPSSAGSEPTPHVDLLITIKR
jgi:hypothetical protein